MHQADQVRFIVLINHSGSFLGQQSCTCTAFQPRLVN